MIHGRLVSSEDRRCIAVDAMRADGMFERMRGLLGRPPLSGQQALLIAPCRSVHTFGMVYPIDLVYLDRDWRIRKLVREMPPWRMSAAPGAAMVVELPGGRIGELGLQTGQLLTWED